MFLHYPECLLLTPDNRYKLNFSRQWPKDVRKREAFVQTERSSDSCPTNSRSCAFVASWCISASFSSSFVDFFVIDCWALVLCGSSRLLWMLSDWHINMMFTVGAFLLTSDVNVEINSLAILKKIREKTESGGLFFFL